MLIKLENAINTFSTWLGRFAAMLLILLLINVFYDVIMRYLFNDVSIGMQELEWHLYAAIFMFGISYAMRVDGHVRVDIFYERWSATRRAWINIFGTVIFLLPFCALVAYYGVNFSYEAFLLNEQSGDPGGLPYRFIIKGVIPLAFMCMIISGLGMLLHNINILRGHHQAAQPGNHHLS